MRREPELIAPRAVEFIAHALVVPSNDPADREQFDAKTEEVAMSLAWAFEESEGAVVKDVHTPELARAAGLSDNPGFDLLVDPVHGKTEHRGQGPGRRWRGGGVRQRVGQGVQPPGAITGSTSSSTAPTPNPRLVRVRDPFGALLAKAKGGMMIGAKQVFEAAEDVTA